MILLKWESSYTVDELKKREEEVFCRKKREERVFLPGKRARRACRRCSFVEIEVLNIDQIATGYKFGRQDLPGRDMTVPEYSKILHASTVFQGI